MKYFVFLQSIRESFLYFTVFWCFPELWKCKIGNKRVKKRQKSLSTCDKTLLWMSCKELMKTNEWKFNEYAKGAELILDNEVMHAFWIKGAQILVIQFSPPWNSLLKWFISHMVYCFFFQCAPWLKLLFVEISNF